MARDWYVSTSGSGTAGTIAAPVALADALNNTSGVTVGAGDVVWQRGGTYTNGNSGATPKFTSTVSGTATAPITYRAYPGERVILDANGCTAACLYVQAAHLKFRDLEFLNSDSVRTGPPTGPEGIFSNRGFGALDIEVINCIFHDNGRTGLDWFPDGASLAYGNICYYNSNTNNGHGTYNNDVDNVTGVGTVYENNISMCNAGYNYHFWGDHNRLRMQYNTSVQPGRLLSDTPGAGGGSAVVGHDNTAGALGPSVNMLIDNFYGYEVDAGPGFAFLYSYFTAGSWGIDNSIISNSYIVGSDIRFTGTLERNNQIFGNFYEGNMFNGTTAHTPLSIAAPPGKPANTVSDGGLGGRPASGKVIKRVANRYEYGRGHITIFNWDHSNTVSVDISQDDNGNQMVKNGDDYAVYWAYNFAAKTACLTGTYSGGTVAIPMTTASLGAMPLPVWSSALQPPTSALPEFAAFIVQTTKRRS